MNGFEIMKIGSVNVNSLVGKVLYVKHLITRFSLNIVAVCETWLVPSGISSFFAIDGFQVVRGDCSNSIRKHVCCLYVCGLSHLFRLTLVCSISLLCCLLIWIFVVVIYRSPSNTAMQDEHLPSFLSDSCVCREVANICRRP